MLRSNNFYILDRNENLQAVVSNDNTNNSMIYKAVLKEELDQLYTLDAELSAEPSGSQYISAENYILFKDLLNNWQLYVIREVAETHSQGYVKAITADHASVELIDELCTYEINGSTSTPQILLTNILAGTRWSVGTVTGMTVHACQNKTKNLSVLGAIQELRSEYGLHIRFRFTVTGSTITGRYVDLLTDIGQDIGKRFEYEKDIESIKRTVDTTDLKTMIIPEGKDGLTISDINWSTPTNPLNKPAGQTYLEDPTATTTWGYGPVGSKRARKVYFIENSIETADELIKQAYNALIQVSSPKVTYEMEVTDLFALTGDTSIQFESVGLGDYVVVSDTLMVPAIANRTQVIKREVDLLNPAETKVTLGNYIESLADYSQQSTLTKVDDKLDSFTLKEFGNGKYGDIQNLNDQDFHSSVGYTYLAETEGLAVYDKPIEQIPTKAVMLKGGKLAMGTWNAALNRWDMTTFIDGNSVNASVINAGFISSDRLQIGSIDPTKLDVTTQATLSSVAGKADTTYVQSQIDAVNGLIALKASQTDVSTAVQNIVLGGTNKFPFSGYFEQGWDYINGGSSANVSTTEGYNNLYAIKDTGVPDRTVATYEETDAAIVYTGTWTAQSDSNYHGGTAKYAQAAGSYAVFTFNGTAVKLYSLKANNQGILNVSIDGGTATAVDLYSATTSYQQLVYTVDGLTTGTHTIRVDTTGTRNASSTGTITVIDYLEVINEVAYTVRLEEYDTNIAYTGTWTTLAGGSYSGGNLKYSTAAGATATLTFVGTGIKVLTTKASGYGMVRLTMDGGTPTDVDLYSASTLYQQVILNNQTLSNGVHTLRMEVLSTKNASSAGYTVAVDCFDITLGSTFIGETDGRIAYTGTWVTQTNTYISGGTEKYTGTTGSYAVCTFYGIGIKLAATAGSNRGIAKITVDNGVPVYVDLYAASWQYGQIVFEKMGLSQGLHTVKVEYTGTKNVLSSNTVVLVDNFISVTNLYCGKLARLATNQNLTVGKTYTVSAQIKAPNVDNGKTAWVGAVMGNGLIPDGMVKATNSWQKYSFTFTYTGGVSYLRLGSPDATSGNYVLISALQLEEATKASDWSPAPGDIDADITSAVNNISVGSRNYAGYSNFYKGDFTGWSNWGTCTRTVELINGKYWAHMTQNDTVNYRGISQIIGTFKPNTPYTISFTAYMSATYAGGVQIGLHQRNSDGSILTPQIWTDIAITTTPTTYSYTFTSANDTTKTAFNLMLGGKNGVPFDIYITEIQFEQGNKATDWRPAPQDYDAQIAATNATIVSVTSRVTTVESKVTPTALINSVSQVTKSAVMGVVQLDDVDPNAVYGGTGWSATTNSNYQNNTYHLSRVAGDYVELSFMGTGVRLYDAISTNRGKIDIYIDDVLDTSAIDRYSSGTTFKVKAYEKTGLTYGPHKVKAVIRSDKNASSTDYYFSVDFFEILNANSVDSTYATNATVTQTDTTWRADFSKVGGNNMLQNSTFRNGFNLWVANGGATAAEVLTGNTMTYLKENTLCINVASTTSDTYKGAYQTVAMMKPNTIYTWSCYLYTSNNTFGSGGLRVYVDERNAGGTNIQYSGTKYINNNTTADLANSTWTKFSMTFTTSSTVASALFRIDFQKYGLVYVSHVKLEEGGVATPHNFYDGEIYSGATAIDVNGITVTHSNSSTATNMNAAGFSVVQVSDGSTVQSVRGNGATFTNVFADDVTSPSIYNVQYDAVTYWCDSTNGSNSYDGLSLATAFKTVNYALSQVGKIFANDITVTIKVASHVKEDIHIEGFQGNGTISMQFNRNIVIWDTIFIRGNTVRVFLDGNNYAGNINGTHPYVNKAHTDSNGWPNVWIINSPYVIFTNMAFVNSLNNAQGLGVVARCSRVYMNNCELNGFYDAIQMYDMSTFSYQKLRGSGNANWYEGVMGCTIIHPVGDNNNYSFRPAGSMSMWSIYGSAEINAAPPNTYGSSITPATYAPYQRVTEWTATQTFSWASVKGYRTDNNSLYDGNCANGDGDYRGYAIFDVTAIKTALTGATINTVEVYLERLTGSGANAPVTTPIYTHNAGYRAANTLGTLITSFTWTWDEKKWVTLPNTTLATQIQGGTARGFAVSGGGYGIFSVNAKIRITYTK